MPYNRWGTWSSFDQEGKKDNIPDFKKAYQNVASKVSAFVKRQNADNIDASMIPGVKQAGLGQPSEPILKAMEQRGTSNTRLIADKKKRKPEVSIERETYAQPGVPRISDQSKRGTGKILLSNDGITGDLSGWKAREAANRKAQETARQPGAGVQVGNMDVQFDNTVSDEARRAFMQNPVRPTAQINRGPRPHPMEGSGMRSQEPTPREEISFDSFGDMIVKGNEMRAEKLQSEIDRNRDKTDLERAKLDVDSENARIYGESTQGLNRQRTASANLDEAKTRLTERVNTLRSELAETDDPAKRAELTQTIRDLLGTQAKTDLTEDQRLKAINDARTRYQTAQTTKPKKERQSWEEWVRTDAPEIMPLLQQAAGDPTAVAGAKGQAPPGAEEEARNNPELADQFEAKYGYRP